MTEADRYLEKLIHKADAEVKPRRRHRQMGHAPSLRRTSPAAGRREKPEWFSFYGRLNRMEFFVRILILTPAYVIGSSLITENQGYLTLLAWGLFAGATIVSVFQITKRLHDLNQSGWLQLLLLIPLVNIGIALWILFTHGMNRANRFGV